MSFTYDIKSELCKIKTSTCCKISECYGILLFGRAFSENSIVFTTEHEEVVDHIIMLFRKCYSVVPSVIGTGNKKDFFTLSVDKKNDREAILNSLGYYGYKEGDTIIKAQNMEEDCCKASFIRGAFLSCGMVSDPHKEYHAEFCIHNKKLGEEMYNFLSECNLSPSITSRGKDAIIYFKESGHIEDLLTTIHATTHTLELAGIKVYKDIRNHYNRLNNCDTANISKTVNAYLAQKAAIEKLRKSGDLFKLSEELQKAAALREKYPEASLRELCGLSDEGLTKSGLNHRLNKIIEISKNI